MQHRHLEIFAVLAAPCLALIVLVQASSGLDLMGLLVALMGYALADFFAGAIHWYCDEMADEKWPWVGPAIVRPFREHHACPEAITKHDVFELCGNNAIASVMVLMLILPVAELLPYLTIGLVSFAISILVTNVFHCWAHLAAPPLFVRALQRARVVLSPDLHFRHHATLDRAYCVTSGWSNSILDAAIRCVRARYRRS